MRALVRPAVLLILSLALAAGVWLGSRGTSPDRRNLDAFVTVSGDVVHDVMHPALDLTRLSSTDEIELGRSIDAEVRGSMPIGGDSSVESYLAELTARVASQVQRRDIPYEPAVVRSDEINAFAVAGGRIYITEGMLDFVASEAELAAVLGHEISHVDLRHCVERLQLQRAAGKVSSGLGALARIGYEVMLRGFSEEQELAADVNGAVLSAVAGYDPWAARDTFERLGLKVEQPGRKPTRDPVVEAIAIIPEALRRYVATHPPADERIAAIRRALVASPGSWRGMRRYIGYANLAARRPMTQDPRGDEWITRVAEPPPAVPERAAQPSTPPDRQNP